MIENTAVFNPDWVSPPGETIVDLLEEQGWSQAELASRIECTTKHVSLLVNGKASLSDDIALRLERVLGGSTRFWLTREAHYRAASAKKAEQENMGRELEWVKELPLKDMIRFGWIRHYSNQADQKIECLKFFGVASEEALRAKYLKSAVAFRASTKCEMHDVAVAAWLRQGERKAVEVQTRPFDKHKLEDTLRELRSLTLETNPKVFVPRLVSACANAGVVVVTLPTPRGCPASGATRWLTSDKGLLMLSFRQKSNDHFWFSFFHEAGHLLLHGKRLSFFECEDNLGGKQEQEADEFASEWLIPRNEARNLSRIKASAREVCAFAARIGVAPGIVVGRLQKEGLLAWSHLNRLKVRYRWSFERRRE